MKRIAMRKGLCAAVVVMLVLGGCGPSEEQRQIAALRDLVARDQRDPAAAQFRDERLVKGSALCGAVNGKNEFGAYSGFTRFVATKELGALVEGARSGAGGQFEFAWASFCAGK